LVLIHTMIPLIWVSEKPLRLGVWEG
jgi:hypothetical protein